MQSVKIKDPANRVVCILRPFLAALTAIAAGSRDPALADSPDLHYTEAAEVLLLIETLAAP